MNSKELSGQCVGLYQELESISALALSLEAEKIAIDEKLEMLRFRKLELKDAIDLNLEQQESFWDLKERPALYVMREDVSALEDYLLNPNQTIKSIADRHGTSLSKLRARISEHLKTA